MSNQTRLLWIRLINTKDTAGLLSSMVAEGSTSAHWKCKGFSRKPPGGGLFILSSLTSERRIKTAPPDFSQKTLDFYFFPIGGVFLSASLRSGEKIFFMRNSCRAQFSISL